MAGSWRINDVKMYLLKEMDIGHIYFQSRQNLLRFAQLAVHRGFLLANVFFFFFGLRLAKKFKDYFNLDCMNAPLSALAPTMVGCFFVSFNCSLDIDCLYCLYCLEAFI